MALVGDPETYVRVYQERGPAFTGLVEGEIMGCAGVCLLWRGVGAAWLVTGPLVPQYPLAFHRAIRDGLQTVMESLHVWRLQADIHQGHEVSQRWVRRLGFAYEGILHKYGPDGADYVRYARVR